MTAACALDFRSEAKFDEPGRQRSLDRLNVVGTKVEAPFEQIVDLVKTTLNAPICAVSLIDNDRQWFKAVRGMGVTQTARDIAFCDHTIRTEAPFIIEDATRDDRFANNPLVTGEPKIRAYLGIPLRMPDGYIVGSLCVIYQEPRVFGEHDIAILQSFANLVVGEMELRMIAFTDGLTGLLSRKAWRQRVDAEIDRATRHATALAVLLLDLDHFKTINDTYGHDVGDIVLRAAAGAVNANLRNHDLGGRLGGEEFAVCLVNLSQADALAVAERIRQAIGALTFPGYDGLACSATIGVAMFAPGRTVDDLLKTADRALYEGKRTGRNQVTLGSKPAAMRHVLTVPQAPATLRELAPQP